MLRWRWDAADLVAWPPSRANAPVDFGGIRVWVITDRQGEGRSFLPWREDVLAVEEIVEGRSWKRRGVDWELSLDWSFVDSGEVCFLEIALEGFSPERLYQVEYQLWAARRGGVWPRVLGQSGGREAARDLKPYGTVVSEFFDPGTDVTGRWEDGSFLRVSCEDAGNCSHYYHRGRFLKLGATSGIIQGGGGVLRARFEATAWLSKAVPAPHGDAGPPTPGPSCSQGSGRTLPPLPEIPSPRDFQSGLMLHLQYTGVSHDLLVRWFELAVRLGYQFILLELNRALACHPAAPPWALSWEALARLVQEARDRGIRLVPGYNLLGHQNETGLLEGNPHWRETHYDCLCPSHPEVVDFAIGLIQRLTDVFQSDLVYVGGDEIRIPFDSRPAQVCPRCGPSPDMMAVIRYWNRLASGARSRLMIAADMLLPRGEFPPPICAHNTDGRAAEYLGALDRSLILLNWQYNAPETRQSIEYLGQHGHEVILVAGQYDLKNPFHHVRTTRALRLPLQIQTTWASPWPDDIPLESVVAGALAHGGDGEIPPDLEATCQRLAGLLASALPERRSIQSV